MRTACIGAAFVVVGSVAAAACDGPAYESPSRNSVTNPSPNDADAGVTEVPEAGVPFEPVGPQTYVPKIKNILTGLPPTDAEMQAVIADPNALRGLIDQWMLLPSFQTKMVDFFRNAFQQNQVKLPMLEASMNSTLNVHPTMVRPRLERSIMDSFPRTVWDMVQKGQPLTTALSTKQYMLTTALMMTMSYVDDRHVDDKNGVINRLTTPTSALAKYVLDSASAVPVADSLNPASPNYMTWRFPGAPPAGCTATTGATYAPAGDAIFYLRLFGFFMGRTLFNPCSPLSAGLVDIPPVLTEADFSDWRLVTVEPATSTRAEPAFFELPKLRNATTLKLNTNRMGYFGTLAFHANWPTNVTNSARVTANQALIVALGLSIDSENTTAMFPVNSTDADHSSNPVCAGCHVKLDPLKQFFRQSYSLSYSNQLDNQVIGQPAGFNIAGGNVAGTGKGVADLPNIFASHPRFPIAWVAKLHFWANSTAAIEDDPEVLRIANAFAASQFDFKVLVRELFSSPLLTWSGPTKTTTTNGVIVSIARRDQFCAALSARFGLSDVCGMQSVTPSASQTNIARRALLLPVDTYFRAFALPSLPTDPDLFFRQSTEGICSLVADQLIDVTPGTSKYTSKDPTSAITDFVGTLMGLVPSDPRATAATAILTDNFNEAKAAPSATPTDALKATFVLACLSPTNVVTGL